jgi:hypothetical protein
MQVFWTIAGAALLLASAFGGSVQAQSICPEGKAFDGQCVNPVLSRAMRQEVIIATQPKISYTAPLNLPREDSFYNWKNPRQRFEYTRLFGSPATRPGGINPVNPITMP